MEVLTWFHVLHDGSGSIRECIKRTSGATWPFLNRSQKSHGITSSVTSYKIQEKETEVLFPVDRNIYIYIYI